MKPEAADKLRVAQLSEEIREHSYLYHVLDDPSIEDSDYDDGWGRFAISTFFGNKFRKSWG